MAYSEKVIDHYNNPRNVGSFKKDDDGVGTGIVGVRLLRQALPGRFIEMETLTCLTNTD